ncbi:MAG: hypothetical protein K2X93_09690 [Candidatus Obscuribacterales bacterium]|nr:hypothetical protein [Candidatus Obscuribacterales bacterium]
MAWRTVDAGGNKLTQKTHPAVPGVSAVSETFIISCNKNAEDVLRALGGLSLDEAFGKSLSPFVVRVSGKQFIIARSARIPNPFARALFGVVNDASHGSVVDYSFSIKPAVRILFSLWFALMTVVFLTGVSAIMTSGITGYRLELVIVAMSFLASALAIVSVCLILSRKDEREMERALVGIIGDTK